MIQVYFFKFIFIAKFNFSKCLFFIGDEELCEKNTYETF